MMRNLSLIFSSLCVLLLNVASFECNAQSTNFSFLYNGSHYQYNFEGVGKGKIDVQLSKNTVIDDTVIPAKISSQPLDRYFTKEQFDATTYFLLQSYEGDTQLEDDSAIVSAIIERAYKKLISELNNPKLDLATAIDNLDEVDSETVAGELTLLNESVALEEFVTEEETGSYLPFWKKGNGEFVESKDELEVNKVAVEFSNTLINKITIDGTINGERVIINPEQYALTINRVNQNNEFVSFDFGAKTYRLNYGYLFKIFPNAETGVLKKNLADNTVLISPTTKTLPLISRGFSDYIAAIIFTDLVGVEDENPNGLLQTEVKAFLPLSSNSNWFKRRVRLFSQIEPYINISKIGGKNYFVETGAFADDTDAMYVNHFDLLRYNNLNFGLKLRLLWWVMPSLSSEFALNGAINGYRTGLEQRYVDANTGKDEFREFNVFSYAPELSGSFILKPDNWIGVSFTEGITKLNLVDADVRSSFGDVSRFRNEDYNGETTGHYFNERFFHFTDVTAFISPSQTKKGGVFVRTRFFKNFSTTNSFYQFQVGYSTDVRNFVNTRK